MAGREEGHPRTARIDAPGQLGTSTGPDPVRSGTRRRAGGVGSDPVRGGRNEGTDSGPLAGPLAGLPAGCGRRGGAGSSAVDVAGRGAARRAVVAVIGAHATAAP